MNNVAPFYHRKESGNSTSINTLIFTRYYLDWANRPLKAKMSMNFELNLYFVHIVSWGKFLFACT